jgi:hypothetical protein
VCDINTPTFQLYTFLFVYNIDFNAYAIFIAEDRGKIHGENSIPPFFTKFVRNILWVTIKWVNKVTLLTLFMVIHSIFLIILVKMSFIDLYQIYLLNLSSNLFHLF